MSRSILTRTFALGFSLTFLGVINTTPVSGAVKQLTPPGQPIFVRVVGGLNQGIVTWKTPESNGGKPITSYKITLYPTKQTHICKSSSVRCVVDVPNPNKPSAKPVPVYYAFTVRATNSIGTGPESAKSGYVPIRFRATITLRPVYPTPKPSPTPTASTPQYPQRLGIKTYDGQYQGKAIVTVTQNENVIAAFSSTLTTSNTVLNGDITGTADIWKISGYVTDASGTATVTASNSMYGAMTFMVAFVSDPTTHAVTGTGKGTNTVEYAGLGTIKVVFDFSISNATT